MARSVRRSVQGVQAGAPAAVASASVTSPASVARPPVVEEDDGNDYRSILFIGSSSDGTFYLNEEAVDFLMRIPGPLRIVAAAGEYRGGKSTLLNGVLCVPHNKGFKASPTTEACTKGLWLHTKVDPSGEGHLLVMDTEGMGAHGATQTHDTRIFALALLLSSVFVFNAHGAITRASLQTLSLVINVAKSLRASSDSETGEETNGRTLAQYMPALWLVLRDFGLDMQDSSGRRQTPNEYLEYNLRPSGQDDDKTRNVLREMFQNRQCWTFPRPTDGNVNLTHEMSASHLSSDFRKRLDEFRNAIHTTAPYKTIHHHRVDGPMLVSLARAYVDAVGNGACPVIRSTLELMAREHAHASINRIMGDTLTTMQQICNSGCVAIEVMDAKLNQISQDAVAKFKSECISESLSESEISECVEEMLRGVTRQRSLLLDTARIRIESEIREVISKMVTSRVAEKDTFEEILEEVNVMYNAIVNAQEGGKDSAHLRATWLSTIQPHMAAWAGGITRKQEQKMAVLVSEINDAHNELQRMQTIVAESEAKLVSLRQECDVQLAVLNMQISSLQNDLEAAKQRSETLEKEMLDGNMQLESVRAAHGQTLVKMSMEIDSLRLCADEAEERNKKLVEELQIAIESAHPLLISAEDLAALHQELSDLKARLVSARSEVDELNAAKARMRLNYEADAARSAKEVTELAEEQKVVRHQYASMVSELEQRNAENEAKLTECLSSLSVLQDHDKKLAADLAAETSRNAAAISQLKSELAESKQTLSAERQRFAEELKTVRTTLEAQVKTVQQQYTQALQSAASARAEYGEERHAAQMEIQSLKLTGEAQKRKIDELETDLGTAKKARLLVPSLEAQISSLQAMLSMRERHEAELQSRVTALERIVREKDDQLADQKEAAARALEDARRKYYRDLASRESQEISQARLGSGNGT